MVHDKKLISKLGFIVYGAIFSLHYLVGDETIVVLKFRLMVSEGCEETSAYYEEMHLSLAQERGTMTYDWEEWEIGAFI